MAGNNNPLAVVLGGLTHKHKNGNVTDDSIPPLPDYAETIQRSMFPPGFIFGAGTSAYQVEGSIYACGKGRSVWDEFTQRYPGKVNNGCNGNTACDMYTRYKDDIKMMKKLGFDAYRFSIAWTRILPGGRCCAGINREGIEYYNNVIDCCIENGLEPFVTLFHWDLPDALEKEYHGFLSRDVVKDFVEYADICFWEFGDRVKHWTILNEPWTYTANGYVAGTFPPYRGSQAPEKTLRKMPGYRGFFKHTRAPKIKGGLSSTDPKSVVATDAYNVASNLLLAHAHTVDLYKKKYKDLQGGKIGVSLNSHQFEPLDPNSQEDKDACIRASAFMLGWFLEPMLTGHYPKVMLDYVPKGNIHDFSSHDAEMLKGSIDFFGLNFYTAMYVSHDPDEHYENGYYADQKLHFTYERNKVPIGKQAGSEWLHICPWGIYKHLTYINTTYGPMGLPPIYITENGVDEKTDVTKCAKDNCGDVIRKEYHRDHYAFIKKAIDEDKVDVRGHFVWSWCDNFEWTEGYDVRFGLVYVDFLNNMTRYPKESCGWFMKFLSKAKLVKASQKRQIANGATPLKRARPNEEEAEMEE